MSNWGLLPPLLIIGGQSTKILLRLLSPPRIPRRSTHHPSGREWLVCPASERDGCPWSSSQRQSYLCFLLGTTFVSVWDILSRACASAYTAAKACRPLGTALNRRTRTCLLLRVRTSALHRLSLCSNSDPSPDPACFRSGIWDYRTGRCLADGLYDLTLADSLPS